MKAVFVVLLALNLSGCFFVFIPGSVVESVSDSFTGAQGEHCITEAAKAGDTVRLVSGEYATIKSVSGHSFRCRNATFPVRALLEMK